MKKDHVIRDCLIVIPVLKMHSDGIIKFFVFNIIDASLFTYNTIKCFTTCMPKWQLRLDTPITEMNSIGNASSTAEIKCSRNLCWLWLIITQKSTIFMITSDKPCALHACRWQSRARWWGEKINVPPQWIINGISQKWHNFLWMRWFSLIIPIDSWLSYQHGIVWGTSEGLVYYVYPRLT